MVMASTAITRYELSQPMSEFDLVLNRKKYIGPKILVPRVVGVQAADVGKIPLKELLQQHDTERAPGAGYRRGDFEFSKFNYATGEYGWEEPIDDRTLAIYADLLDAESIHADRAIGFVADQYERDVAAATTDNAVWTGAALTTAATAVWSDHANAKPVDDLLNAKEKVRLGSGLEPNYLQINTLQWEHLLACDQIIERVKYTSRATAQEMALAIADVLNIPEIIVAGGLTNTANPEATAVIARVWGNTDAMVGRRAMSADPKEPCVGRTFIWSGDGPGAVGTSEALAILVEEYREESVRGSVIRARNDRDLVIMYTAAAHRISGVLA